jgi:hypothetical protein
VGVLPIDLPVTLGMRSPNKDIDQSFTPRRARQARRTWGKIFHDRDTQSFPQKFYVPDVLYVV